jgi:hypothetical protein
VREIEAPISYQFLLPLQKFIVIKKCERKREVREKRGRSKGEVRKKEEEDREKRGRSEGEALEN